MFEMLLAAVALVASLALLVRLGIGRQRRARLDEAAVRVWSLTRHGAIEAWRWPTSRRRAARLAREVIGRARGRHPQVGNVVRPKSFRERRKLH